MSDRRHTYLFVDSETVGGIDKTVCNSRSGLLSGVLEVSERLTQIKLPLVIVVVVCRETELVNGWAGKQCQVMLMVASGGS